MRPLPFLAMPLTPLVVRAADSMLRRADRAQAGNRRLQDQAVTMGFGESGPFVAQLLKRGIKRLSLDDGGGMDKATVRPL
jgi:hypothetical protein